MFPAVLDLGAWPVAVVGRSPAAVRRVALLDEAGAGQVRVFAQAPSRDMCERAGLRLTERLPTAEEIGAVRVVFTAGLARETAEWIAEVARGARVLVNTEDVPELCDFHVPAMVRRGDLLMTVSTDGRAPGLARALRRDLEARYGPEWETRLGEVADLRNRWRAEGRAVPEVAQATDDHIAREGWLA